MPNDQLCSLVNNTDRRINERRVVLFALSAGPIYNSSGEPLFPNYKDPAGSYIYIYTRGTVQRKVILFKCSRKRIFKALKLPRTCAQRIILSLFSVNGFVQLFYEKCSAQYIILPRFKRVESLFTRIARPSYFKSPRVFFFQL